MRMCPFSLDRDAQVTAGRRGAKGALGAVQREQLDALGLVWDMRERRDTSERQWATNYEVRSSDGVRG